MKVRDLYQYTLDQIADTSEESYPFDIWKKDAYFFLKKYARQLHMFSDDKDFYVETHEFNIVPSCSVSPGMEGYMGMYNKPDDFKEFIRMEIAYEDNCFKKMVREDLNTHECGSENYDDCCNCCKVCRDKCHPTFEFERDLIILKWIPTRNAVMKMWYFRTVKPLGDSADAVVDFDEEFVELIALQCAKRYMFMRHEGQYGKYANSELKEELDELSNEFKDYLRRRHGVDDSATIVPIKKY